MDLSRFLVRLVTLYLLFVGVYCGRRSRYKRTDREVEESLDSLADPSINSKSKTRIINIAVLLPDNNDLDYSLSKVLPAVELAVNAVNDANNEQKETVANSSEVISDPDGPGPVYRNWNLRINAMDTNCSSITGPLAAFELYSRGRADVFLGPVCDYVLAPVARYAGRWGLPVLTPGGHASSFKMKDDHFPTLTRLLGGYSHVGTAMKTILQHFRWNNIGLLFHNHARESGKGNSDCHFTLGAIFSAMKRTDAFHRSFDENEFSDDAGGGGKDGEGVKKREKRRAGRGGCGGDDGIGRTNEEAEGEGGRPLGGSPASDSRSDHGDDEVPPSDHTRGNVLPSDVTSGPSDSTSDQTLPSGPTSDQTPPSDSTSDQTLPNDSASDKLRLSDPARARAGLSDQTNKRVRFVDSGAPTSDEKTLRKRNVDDGGFGKSNSEKRKNKYRELLATLSKSAKIAVLCASPGTIREIMLAADDLNMVSSGEYVFFNIELYTSMSSASLKPWFDPADTEDNNRRARRAYEALLTVTAQTPGDRQYREFSQQVKSLSKSKYNYTFEEDEPLSTFVTAFYDAVTLYARSLNASLSAGSPGSTGSSAGSTGPRPGDEAFGRPLNGSDITRRMRGTRFKGITGDVIIDSNGDRLSDYSLMDMNPETGTFEVVANYMASSRALEFVPGRDVHWPGGAPGPPLDRPVCGYDMSLCPDNSLPGYAILSIVLSAVLVVVLVVAALLYKRYRDEADLLSMSWMVDYRDVIPIPAVSGRHQTRGSCATLTAAVNNPNLLTNYAETPVGNASGAPPEAGVARRGSQVTIYSLDCFAKKSSGRQLFCQVAAYSGVRVAVKALPAVRTRVELTRELRIELRMMKHLSHDHLTRFYGACMDPPGGHSMLLTEYCPRGSLQDVLENCELVLDSMFRISLMQDIVRGMCYLHNSDIKSHGSLKSSNCVVDSRFVLKITDFGLHALRNPAANSLETSACCEDKRIRSDAEGHSRRYKNKAVGSYKWRNRIYRKNSVNGIKSRWRRDKPGVADVEDALSGSTPKHQDGSVCNDYTSCDYEERNNKESHAYWRQLFWTAPELLRMGSLRPPAGTQKGDVYSFGIIVHEIVARMGAFYRDDNMTPQEIVEGVRRGPLNSSLGSSPGSPNPLAGSLSPNSAHHGHGVGCATGGACQGPLVRPTVGSDTDQQLTEIMNHCWNEDPNHRPDFNSLKATVRRLNKDQESGNILDNLLSRMEQYANNLETLVEERTRDYFEEKRKCEELLYQLLPKTVASQLISGGAVAAETYDEVTVYFSDIVGFTQMSAQSTPMEVVDLLNDLYSCFDSIIENFDVYKVETIGDAYMVVSGLPTRNESRHASEIARMALALLRAVDKFTIRHRPQEKLLLRIGMHTGPCVAGVVGRVMPRYCLFGDTVNTASRMESHGEPLKIHVSPHTKKLLDAMGGFLLQERGEICMKGKPPMITYWLLGEAPVESKMTPEVTNLSNKTNNDEEQKQNEMKVSNSDLSKTDICDLEFFTKDDFCEVEIHDETVRNRTKSVRFPGLTTPEIVCSGPEDEFKNQTQDRARNEKIRSRSPNSDPAQCRRDFFEPKPNQTADADSNRPKSDPNIDQKVKPNYDAAHNFNKMSIGNQIDYENLELTNLASQTNKYNDTGQKLKDLGQAVDLEKNISRGMDEELESDHHSILKNKIGNQQKFNFNNNNNLQKAQQVQDECSIPLLDK